MMMKIFVPITVAVQEATRCEPSALTSPYLSADPQQLITRIFAVYPDNTEVIGILQHSSPDDRYCYFQLAHPSIPAVLRLFALKIFALPSWLWADPFSCSLHIQIVLFDK
jgi:hypothetical protein